MRDPDSDQRDHPELSEEPERQRFRRADKRRQIL
jgi:hypothetical protein